MTHGYQARDTKSIVSYSTCTVVIKTGSALQETTKGTMLVFERQDIEGIGKMI
jgi:hypothetical protein